MSNTVLIVSEEFLNRIKVGLSEIAAKFANPVFVEIEDQIKAAETGAAHYVSALESHLAAIKAKVVTEVKKVEAEVADVKTVVSDVEKAV